MYELVWLKFADPLLTRFLKLTKYPDNISMRGKYGGIVIFMYLYSVSDDGG